MTASTDTCPQCRSTIPGGPWPPWCEKCSWGITARPLPPPTSKTEALLREIGERVGRRQLDRLKVSPTEETSRFTTATAVAVVIALVVHLFTALLVVLGVVLLVTSWRNPFADVAALLLLATAWLMRPHLGSVPKENRVSADDAPALHRLIVDVAGALGTRLPNFVVVSSEWNASFGVAGLRRRRSLELGLPLFTALRPQERVALVAHELAHGRHRDSVVQLVCGSAINSLATLDVLLEPVYDDSTITTIQRFLFWPVRKVIRGVIALEIVLLSRDSQRAEYLADSLAAETAGADAEISSHETMLLAPDFYAIVSRNVQRVARGETTVFAELDSAVAAVDARERDRRRRIARLEQSRLDASHPPTARRIELIESRPYAAPRVHLRERDSIAIDNELARFRKTVADDLIDQARGHLYA